MLMKTMYCIHIGELPQDMTDMETLAFMKIITGEEPISYFDFFTESWKKNMILENLLY